jgi:hypothetical protein
MSEHKIAFDSCAYDLCVFEENLGGGSFDWFVDGMTVNAVLSATPVNLRETLWQAGETCIRSIRIIEDLVKVVEHRDQEHELIGRATQVAKNMCEDSDVGREAYRYIGRRCAQSYCPDYISGHYGDNPCKFIEERCVDGNELNHATCVPSGYILHDGLTCTNISPRRHSQTLEQCQSMVERAGFSKGFYGCHRVPNKEGNNAWAAIRMMVPRGLDPDFGFINSSVGCRLSYETSGVIIWKDCSDLDDGFYSPLCARPELEG